MYLTQFVRCNKIIKIKNNKKKYCVLHERHSGITLLANPIIGNFILWLLLSLLMLPTKIFVIFFFRSFISCGMRERVCAPRCAHSAFTLAATLLFSSFNYCFSNSE